MINNYSIGSDIELFLRDKQTGEIVSAEGIAKGTKHEPYVFDPSSKYFATSLDNVLYEFCIPPSRRLEEFVNNIKKSMSYVNATLPDRLCYAPIASARLAMHFLETENAQIFGCEPDYNAWTGNMNNAPSVNTSLRSAGFHVHVGFDDPNREEAEELVRAMDLLLGVPSVLIDPDKDRRNLYGRAGSFRPKPYGLEYRVLSSFFASSEELMAWVYESTIKAIDFVNKGNSVQLPKVFLAIDNSIEGLAKELVQEFNITLP
jgi:Phage phiEco32-like COOH.NH2 ligase-type 2